MSMSPPGPAAARKSDALPGLEVRSPVQAGRSTADLVEQMLARVRAGEDEPAPASAPALEGGLLTPRTPPGAAVLAGLAAATAAPAPAPPSIAAGLIDPEAPWLPAEPERKAVFLQVFRYWHAQVRPEYADKAVPALLFLITALPVMVKARDDLKALKLWEPSGDPSRAARDQHSAWRKYCEFLPRAQQALQEIKTHRHISLMTALDDLMASLTALEKRYREGPPRK